jgi:hypothetical protein
MFKNAQKPAPAKAPAKPKPVHRISCGALSVSIWEQRTPEGCFYTCNAQRAYTKDDGATWDHSDSFSGGDVAIVASLMIQAHAWMIRKDNEK